MPTAVCSIRGIGWVDAEQADRYPDVFRYEGRRARVQHLSPEKWRTYRRVDDDDHEPDQKGPAASRKLPPMSQWRRGTRHEVSLLLGDQSCTKLYPPIDHMIAHPVSGRTPA